MKIDFANITGMDFSKLTRFSLRLGETIEFKRPFMVPRLNSDEY